MERLKFMEVEQVIKKLKSWVYKPTNDGISKISFSSFGSSNFSERQKSIVRKILGNRLLEFFYGCDTQSIYYAK